MALDWLCTTTTSSLHLHHKCFVFLIRATTFAPIINHILTMTLHFWHSRIRKQVAILVGCSGCQESNQALIMNTYLLNKHSLYPSLLCSLSLQYSSLVIHFLMEGLVAHAYGAEVSLYCSTRCCHALASAHEGQSMQDISALLMHNVLCMSTCSSS